MKKISIGQGAKLGAWAASLAVLLAGVGVAQAQVTRFLSAIDDIPLHAALQELGEPMVFETDFGRVIQVRAGGILAESEALGFYQETLPSLGWTAEPERDGIAELVYVRGFEHLEIDLETRPPSERSSSDMNLNVKFKLVVLPASNDGLE